jgi:hypothetical protein
LPRSEKSQLKMAAQRENLSNLPKSSKIWKKYGEMVKNMAIGQAISNPFPYILHLTI